MAAKYPSALDDEDLRDIPPEKLDQPCQDKHLCQVAREITNWPFLAPFLGIKLSEVEAIRGRWPYDVTAQKLELLRQWQHKHRRKGKDSYRNLRIAFLKAQEVTLADKVCDVVRGQGNSSEDSSDEAEIDPLELFADYLRTTYGVQIPDFVVFQWPPPLTRKVLNLAMICSHEIVRRQLPTEELVRLMQRGNVSSAIQGSTSVQLENLFDLDDRERKVILIEGAPGAGKSTLAWHICQKWKTRELFHEFKVVIHVQLRDPDIQRATSLADILPTDSEETRSDVTTHIKSCLGKGVLFVLDGWDEFEPGLNGFVGTLIRNPQKARLQCSTLLITSRPNASSHLQPYTSSRVEIVGFTRDDVRQYFEDALGDSLALQNLHGLLRERPVLEASCYRPLNAAMVVHLFIERNHTLPTTLHGVFSAVVCGCIRRHLKRKSGKEEEIPSLDKLPLDVQKDFQSMCTLAYEGSMVNKVTFSGQDLHSYGLSTELNVLDLMQVVSSFASRKSTSSHFLHLSVQELLTALHISKLPPAEQVRIFNEKYANPRFAAVLRYYSAFTKLQTKGFKKVIAQIARGRKERLLNLIHCLYEADDISLCCFVASQLKTGLDLRGVTLSPLDCLSVGYFLSCIALALNTTEVNLFDSSIDDYSVSFLAKGLSMCVCNTPGVEGSSSHDPPPGHLPLNLHGNSISGVGVRCLSDVISHHNVISELNLSHNHIQEGEDGFKHLLQALRTNTSVIRLFLYHCGLRVDADSCPLLVEMLRKNKTLKVMDLDDNFVSDEGLLGLGEGLKENRGLETLNIRMRGEAPGVGAWQQFVLCLNENRHLTKLIVPPYHSAVYMYMYVRQGLHVYNVWCF